MAPMALPSAALRNHCRAYTPLRGHRDREAPFAV